MTSGLYAKLESEDADYRSRVVTLHSHSKSIVTPMRAFNLAKGYTESKTINNNSIRGINEVVRTLNYERLNIINTKTKEMEDFSKDLRSRFSKIDLEKEVSFFMFFYDSNGKPPTDKQIELLASLVSGNHYNDIIVPPIIRGISSEDYLKYLNSFMLSLKSYVKKPQIMGTVPHLARIELQDICKFYMDQGVTVFGLDVDGKNPLDMYTNINEVYSTQRKIEKEYLTGEECSYLHGINLRKPRGLMKKGTAVARDLLVFEMGFNSFGPSHIVPKMNWANLPPDNVAWVLCREDYAYYPITSAETRNICSEARQTISLDDVISSSKARDKARIFNAERQGMEAKEVQTRINEHDLSKYLSTKSQAADSLKQIKKKMQAH